MQSLAAERLLSDDQACDVLDEWLQTEFGLNVTATGKESCFDECRQEFTVQIDDENSVRFDSTGNFTRVEPAHPGSTAYRRLYLQKGLDKDVGRQLMQEAAVRHGLDFSWEDTCLLIRSSKLFCRGLTVRLLPAERSPEDDADMDPQFTVKGFKDYRPLPSGSQEAQHMGQMHALVLSMMLRNSMKT